MGVGVSYPASSIALRTLGLRFRSENLVMRIRGLRTQSWPVRLSPGRTPPGPVVLHMDDPLRLPYLKRPERSMTCRDRGGTVPRARKDCARCRNNQVKSGKYFCLFALRAKTIECSAPWLASRARRAGEATQTSS